MKSPNVAVATVANIAAIPNKGARRAVVSHWLKGFCLILGITLAALLGACVPGDGRGWYLIDMHFTSENNTDGNPLASFSSNQEGAELTLHASRLPRTHPYDPTDTHYHDNIDEIITAPVVDGYTVLNWQKIGAISIKQRFQGRWGEALPFWALSSKLMMTSTSITSEIYSPYGGNGSEILSKISKSDAYPISAIWFGEDYPYSVLFLNTLAINEDDHIILLACVAILSDLPPTSMPCYALLSVDAVTDLNTGNNYDMYAVNGQDTYIYAYASKSQGSFPKGDVDLKKNKSGASVFDADGSAKAGEQALDRNELIDLFVSSSIMTRRFKLTVLNTKDTVQD